MALRRRGKILPFKVRPASDGRLIAPAGMLRERIHDLHVQLAPLLERRVAAIEEETTDEGLRMALAELEAQTIVLGGYAFRARGCLPARMREFLDANMDGFANWLDKRRG